jgi:DNA-binding MarR family transcriptional regulator
MHAISFALKRVQHRTLAISRRLLKGLALTPARFDMLYAIADTANRRLPQRTLCKKLGVTAPTVSRMAKSLEALGFIARRRSPYDHRRLDVYLTALGSYHLVYCIRETSAPMHFLLERAMSKGDWFLDVAEHAMLDLDDQLFWMRKSMGDRAWLHYPFHPDD